MGWLDNLISRRRGGAPDLFALTQHLALDPDADTTAADQPGFMAPPAGAPPYHGFRVLEEIEVDGFRLGAITDFVRRPDLDTGDGFVVAPDGSRAGLEWRRSTEAYLLEMAPFTPNRWGVWMVGMVHPMDGIDNARRNLAELVPLLEPKWRDWVAYRTVVEAEPTRRTGQ